MWCCFCIILKINKKFIRYKIFINKISLDTKIVSELNKILKMLHRVISYIYMNTVKIYLSDNVYYEISVITIRYILQSCKNVIKIVNEWSINSLLNNKYTIYFT